MSKTFTSTIPPSLKKGDQVAIVATARYADLKILEFAEQLLESWGLKLIRGKNLLKKHYNFAGNDAERLEDLQWAMDHPELKAIFCFRGGYGSTRILEKIEAKKLFLDWSNTSSFNATPGVINSVTPRLTIFFVFLGSSNCSQIATRFPAFTNFERCVFSE